MLISVNGFEEAKSYPVLFNNTELLMDNNRDVFYVKSVDAMGKYTVNTYGFEKIENEKPLTAENFVTRAQFDSLNGKLDLLLQGLTPQNVAPVEPDSTGATNSVVSTGATPATQSTGKGGK